MNPVRRFSLFTSFALSLALPVLSWAAIDSTRDCTEMKSARSILAQKSATLGSSEIARIDVHAEYASFNLAAMKLRTLARFGRCGLHLGSDSVEENFIVCADNGAVDEFNVSGEGREVIQWKSSPSATASTKEIHFSSRGEVDSVKDIN